MRTLLLFLVFTLCAVIAFAQFENSLDRNDYPELFQEWKAFYGKSYSSPQEEKIRFRNFVDAVHRARALNLDHDTNAHGINPFSDLTREEFAQQYLLPSNPLDFVDQEEFNATRMAPEDAGPLTNPRGILIRDAAGKEGQWGSGWNPNTVYDWTYSGYIVSPVKDQGQCGSCWAFSATEQIESNWAFHHGLSSPILSPQQIVSCDPVWKPYGCNGGSPMTAYNYVKNIGGLETASAYPYTASNGVCTDNGVKVVKISGYQTVGQYDEAAMYAFLSTGGPLSICLNADNLETYAGGGAILPGSTCNPNAVDHCVQLTGFMTDAYGNIKAWNIRNSWGTWWGNSGYAFLQYGVNACALSGSPTIAVPSN